MNKNTTLSEFFRPIVLIIIITTLNIGSLNAAESKNVALWVGVDTHHIDRANDEANNEKNKITSIFYNRWFVSSFINSYSKRSYLVGYHVWYNQMIFLNTDFDINYGLSIAAATGYGRNLATNIDGLVTLGLSPFIGAKYPIHKHWQLGGDIIYIPTDNGGVLTTGVSLNYQF